MSLLYVSENGAQINLESNRVMITYKDGLKRLIPIETLESVMLLGSAQITTQCMEEFLQRGIPTAFLSKGGRYYGRLISTGHTKAALQRIQSKLYDEPFSLELGRKIISAKINNQIVVLRRYSKSVGFDAASQEVQMSLALKKIETVESIEELNGYEGIAAKYYFAGLSHCIFDEFKFSGRNRRPPLDPFNSMISLGYSILMNMLYAEIENRGLNPYFGFIHRDKENHPTLASDLIEEWRAVIVDAFVMSLVNGKEIHKDNFYFDTDNPGCYIDKAGLKIFLNKLENKLKTDTKYLKYVDYPVSFRRAIGLQIARLAEAIENNDASIYEPVRIR